MGKKLWLWQLFLCLLAMGLFMGGTDCQKKNSKNVSAGGSGGGSGISLPLTPNLNAATVGSQINLSWSDSDNETLYKIERKTGVDGTYAQIATVGANIWAYSDMGPFSPSTYYYYHIKASNEAGDSPYSNEVGVAFSGNWSATVAAGESHTIAGKTNGALWTWGRNNYGQLGLGDTITRTTPTRIGNDTTWSLVTAGLYHTIASKMDGSLWAWGLNINGQLGFGDTINRNTPTQMITTTIWSAIAAGDSYTIARKNDGTLWSWGYNSNGQLGVGDTINKNAPTRIGAETTWNSIAAGCVQTIACKNTGTLWVWGGNANGVLGLGDTLNRTTPSQLGAETTWSAVTVGGILKAAGGLGEDTNTCYIIARKINGTLWAWGNNTYGQLGLGDGALGGFTSVPTQIGNETNWSLVIAGLSHAVAIKINGTLWAWGNNASGQLGVGDLNWRTNPSQVGTNTDWSSFAAGDAYTIARKTNGILWAWGSNSSGQLGMGISSNIPILVVE